MNAKLLCVAFIIYFITNISGLRDGCTEVYYSTELSSENFPQDYPSNHHSCLIFHAFPGEHAQIEFTSMQLEETEHCIFDSVKIYNDFEGESLQGCPLCFLYPNDLPKPIVSTGSQMMVTFESDGSVQYSGFRAVLSSLDLGSSEVEVDQCPTQIDPFLVNETNVIDEGPDYPHVPVQPVYPYSDYIMLPASNCSDEGLFPIIDNVLERVKELQFIAFDSMRDYYINAGVDLSDSDDVRRLACYFAEVEDIGDLMPLVPWSSIEEIGFVYGMYVPLIAPLDENDIRDFLLTGRKFLVWLRDTMFPNLPLQSESYADTWQFFVNLQNGISSEQLEKIRNIENLLLPVSSRPVSSILTTSPESLARVLHGDSLEAISEVTDPNGLLDDLTDGLQYATTQELDYAINNAFPLYLAISELYNNLVSRGWLELE